MNNKELAEHRADLLWQRYRENGDRITCAEVYDLTDKRVTELYRTFGVQRVKAPPVWDTKKAIRNRQIKALNAKAAELGRNWLSTAEAVDATGVSKNNIYALRDRLRGYIPEIRNDLNRNKAKNITPKNTLSEPTREQDIDRVLGIAYYDVLPGPEPGLVRYLLK